MLRMGMLRMGMTVRFVELDLVLSYSSNCFVCIYLYLYVATVFRTYFGFVL